jgi:RES domain-containing protein
MTVFRIARRRWAKDLSGKGAMLEGGRWNSQGVPLIYTSATRSLALLEILAHATIAPADLVIITIKLPPRLRITSLDESSLPKDWNRVPPSRNSKRIGDRFCAEGSSLALIVPSIIVPGEQNVLLNPNHPHASKIEIVSADKLPIDARLF